MHNRYKGLYKVFGLDFWNVEFVLWGEEFQRWGKVDEFEGVEGEEAEKFWYVVFLVSVVSEFLLYILLAGLDFMLILILPLNILHHLPILPPKQLLKPTNQNHKRRIVITKILIGPNQFQIQFIPNQYIIN